MRNFEIYERRTATRFRGPAVTLTQRGVISFSAEAYDLLGQPEAVTLLYDKGDRIIGFKPAAKNARNAYTIRLTGHSTRALSAKRFCDYIDVQLDGARRWPLTMEDGIGCADLKQPGTFVTSNRKGGQS
jgi:hypothetical protein